MTSRNARRGAAYTGLFRVADPSRGMARIPLLPYDLETGEGTNQIVTEGMHLCSDMRHDASIENEERRRATARAFEIRTGRRTTPQGVFAAVAELTFTDGAAHLAMGATRARSFPSPVWLQAICDKALDGSAILRGLTFTSNNLAVRRGSRLEVERPTGDSLDGPDRVSIHATAAVDFIMGACRTDASWQEIVTPLLQQWPNVPDERVDALIREMVRSGFLLTDLAPADTCNDPLGHVLTKLPADEPLGAPVSALRDALAAADTHQPGHPARLAALENARSITDGMFPTWRPLGTDTASDAAVSIPTSLADQLAQAAGVLWCLAPREDPLATWHRRFLDRHGAHRAVPLVEVCDPVTGFGCDLPDPEPHQRSASVEALTMLLSQALASDDVEVVLSETTIDALDRHRPGDLCAPSAEIYARVIARDHHDRDAGNFMLAITNMASPAGSTRGRFTGLMPAVEQPSTDDTITAELVVQPVAHGAAALVGTSDAAQWRIPIGTIPKSGDLSLDELAIISDGQRLSVWSMRHNRPVRPVHHNQLGHHLMPSLAGFLCRIGQHGTIALSPWDWTPLDRAPFLPRVRFKDVILSPARWRLPAEVRDAARDRHQWEASLQHWRSTTRPAPPAVVVVADTDRHLPLELDHDDDRELLRRYVGRGVKVVTEPPGGTDALQGVVRGEAGLHALEIVVPLASVTKLEPVPPPHRAAARRAGTGAFAPGSQWLSLAIQAPPSAQDAVLARIANIAQAASDLWKQWFWLRYYTPETGSHLRIRFRGDPSTLGGQLLPLLGHTCAELTSHGLSGGFTIEAYHQEIERYGGPNPIELAESVFHHDANLTAALLATHADPDDRLALTALSAAAIARTIAASDRAALAPYRLERAERRIQSRLQPRARALDDAAPPCPHLWQQRIDALLAYRNALSPERRIDCASSMIHMHANRMLGNNDHERIARAIAADLLWRKP